MTKTYLYQGLQPSTTLTTAIYPYKAADWERNHLANDEAQRKWEEEEKERKDWGAYWHATLSGPRGLIILKLLASTLVGWVAGPWLVFVVQVLSLLFIIHKAISQLLYQGGRERVSSAGTIELVALELRRAISQILWGILSGTILGFRIIWSFIKLSWSLVAGIFHSTAWPIRNLWPGPTHDDILWRRLHEQVRTLDTCCNSILASGARSMEYANPAWSELCQNHVEHVFHFLNGLPTTEDLGDAAAYTHFLHEKLRRMKNSIRPPDLVPFSTPVNTVRNKLSSLLRDHGAPREYDHALYAGFIVILTLQISSYITAAVRRRILLRKLTN